MAIVPAGRSATYDDGREGTRRLLAAGASARPLSREQPRDGLPTAGASGASGAARSLLWKGERNPSVVAASTPLDTAIATGLSTLASVEQQSGQAVQVTLVPPSPALPQFVLSYVQHYVYFGAYLVPSFTADFFTQGGNR